MDVMRTLWGDDTIANTAVARRPRAPARAPTKTAAVNDRHLLICEVCLKSTVLHTGVLGQNFAEQALSLGWHEVPERANSRVFRQWCPEHRQIGEMVFDDDNLELGE